MSSVVGSYFCNSRILVFSYSSILHDLFEQDDENTMAGSRAASPVDKAFLAKLDKRKGPEKADVENAFGKLATLQPKVIDFTTAGTLTANVAAALTTDGCNTSTSFYRQSSSFFS